MSNTDINQLIDQRTVKYKNSDYDMPYEQAREAAAFDVLLEIGEREMRPYMSEDKVKGYASNVADQFKSRDNVDGGINALRHDLMHAKTYKPTKEYIASNKNTPADAMFPHEGVYSRLDTRLVRPKNDDIRKNRIMEVLKDKYREHYNIKENDSRFDRISVDQYAYGMPFHITESEFFDNVSPEIRNRMWEGSRMESKYKNPRMYKHEMDEDHDSTYKSKLDDKDSIISSMAIFVKNNNSNFADVPHMEIKDYLRNVPDDKCDAYQEGLLSAEDLIHYAAYNSNPIDSNIVNAESWKVSKGNPDVHHTQEMLDADDDNDGTPNIIDPDDDGDGIADVIDDDRNSDNMPPPLTDDEIDLMASEYYENYDDTSDSNEDYAMLLKDNKNDERDRSDGTHLTDSGISSVASIWELERKENEIAAQEVEMDSDHPCSVCNFLPCNCSKDDSGQHTLEAVLEEEMHNSFNDSDSHGNELNVKSPKADVSSVLSGAVFAHHADESSRKDFESFMESHGGILRRKSLEKPQIDMGLGMQRKKPRPPLRMPRLPGQRRRR